MSDGPYFIEHGDVWHRSQSPLAIRGAQATPSHIADATEFLGVAYDAESGVLHKHGAGASVSAWADETRKKLVDTGFPDMASELVVLQFAISPDTVAELNACIACTGRILSITERLEQIAPQPHPAASLR